MTVENKYSEMKREIAEKIIHCRKVLEAIYGFSIPGISVNFKLRGKTAGMFYVKYKNVNGITTVKCEIKLNARLMLENYPEFLKNVVPHEFCHYVTFLKKIKEKSSDKKKYASHGPVWKKMMIDLGLSPDRCHNFDVESTQRNVKRHLYKCACQTELKISTVIHNRIRSGRKYICKTCKEPIQSKSMTTLD